MHAPLRRFFLVLLIAATTASVVSGVEPVRPDAQACVRSSLERAAGTSDESRHTDAWACTDGDWGAVAARTTPVPAL